MAKRPFPTNPAYLESLRGLHRLHALTAAGQSQSAEADAVRDGLEGPWYSLSEAEQKRISGLSADLYSLSDLATEPLPPEPRANRKLMEMVRARDIGDWDRALELLRRWGRYLEPAVLSYARGDLWLNAGDAETATLFLRHAVDLQPSDDTFLASYFFALEKSSPDDAIRRARAIVDGGGQVRPIEIAWAGSVVLRSLRSTEGDDRDAGIRHLVEKAGRGLADLQASGSGNIDDYDSIFVMLIETLSACHRALGDTREALRLLDSGIASVPDRPEFYFTRGVIRYGSGPSAANDIALAIQLGFRDAWAYFFLAHYNLTSGSFAECLRMCDRALEHPDANGVKAMKTLLHEWQAIARSELGFPAEMVRSDLEEAARLAPENDEIRQNLERFNRSGGQPGARPHDWAMPRASAIQALYPFEPISPLSPAA